jgi:aryl-alcohol dehydrogenase-like predicted oxidoreductase
VTLVFFVLQLTTQTAQLKENIGAQGWRLSADDVALLDKESLGAQAQPSFTTRIWQE